MPTLQGKYWIGTLSYAHAREFNFWNADEMAYLIGQREIGTGGFEHWQFVVGFHNRKTLSQAKALFHQTVHFELTRSAAAHAYVTKEDTAVPDTRFLHGALPVRRNNKTDWAKVLSDAKRGAFDDIPEDIFIRHHSSIKRIRIDHCEPTWRHDIQCHVYWGGSGLGKTRRAHFQSEGEPYFIKNPNTKWWDGYRGQKTVIIDDFIGLIALNYLLTWIDRYPCNVEVKGGSIPLAATTFYITSNLDPNTWYKEITPEQLGALRRRFTTVVHFLGPWVPPSPIEQLADIALLDELIVPGTGYYSGFDGSCEDCLAGAHSDCLQGALLGT